jgi:hypothetical protein
MRLISATPISQLFVGGFCDDWMYINQWKVSKISFTDDETWSTVLNPELSCNYHSANSLSFPERKKNMPHMQQNQNDVDYLLQLLRVLHHDHPPKDKI